LVKHDWNAGYECSMKAVVVRVRDNLPEIGARPVAVRGPQVASHVVHHAVDGWGFRSAQRPEDGVGADVEPSASGPDDQPSW
jgi:hypothetical protein